MKYVLCFLAMFCSVFASQAERLKPLDQDEPHFQSYRVLMLENHITVLKKTLQEFKSADDEKKAELLIKMENDIEICLYFLGLGVNF